MKKFRHKRILAKHVGSENGPMVIAIGGMHGNEKAGIHAIDIMSKMIEVEPITNPDFEFRGKFLGLSGNLQALKRGVRFIKKDLNRQLTEKNILNILQTDKDSLKYEDKEIYELLNIIHREVNAYHPREVIVLDLHTTTAFGGIFSIVNEEVRSIELGLELHCPVITDMIKGIQGTTLHYFHGNKLGVPTSCIVFESGQHDETLSINRAIAALTKILGLVGCFDLDFVENRHESLLIEYAKGLPEITKLIHTHEIKPNDRFRMRPGYKNFQKVKKGTIVAEDKHGPIVVEEDSLILMPLYQPQGDDGFFLIQEIEAEALQRV